jgi:hypothetical protein
LGGKFAPGPDGTEGGFYQFMPDNEKVKTNFLEIKEMFTKSILRSLY